MITCLACSCHSAEPLIRRTLRSAGYPGYLTEPIIKGKQACLEYLDTLPENLETGSLRSLIKSTSSFAVILGHGDAPDDYIWAEIGHSGVKGRVDGEIIIKKYGGEQ